MQSKTHCHVLLSHYLPLMVTTYPNHLAPPAACGVVAVPIT